MMQPLYSMSEYTMHRSVILLLMQYKKGFHIYG